MPHCCVKNNCIDLLLIFSLLTAAWRVEMQCWEFQKEPAMFPIQDLCLSYFVLACLAVVDGCVVHVACAGSWCLWLPMEEKKIRFWSRVVAKRCYWVLAARQFRRCFGWVNTLHECCKHYKLEPNHVVVCFWLLIGVSALNLGQSTCM